MLVILEAGTGIEPVYSDLQSKTFQSKINRIGGNRYQDKRSTAGEHDTLLCSGPIASEMKKTGALAGATGAIGNDLAITPEQYRKPPRNAMSLYAQDRHKRATRMLGYALTADEPDTWQGTIAVWAARLTTKEIASIAYAALSVMEPEHREAVYGAAQWGVA